MDHTFKLIRNILPITQTFRLRRMSRTALSVLHHATDKNHIQLLWDIAEMDEQAVWNWKAPMKWKGKAHMW